jgi:ABC-2 type transport system ATP-binding protein
MVAIVDLHALTKHYSDKTALHEVSLTLSRGIHLLRGANGSGKSTLLKVLAGVETYNSGTACIDGFDLRTHSTEAKQQLGWLPSEPQVYGFLRGDEFLRLVAAARGVRGVHEESAIRDMLAALGLTPHISQRFDTMSLGMQRKHMIVAAFMGAPKLLLLDEPANALDAAALDTLGAMVAKSAETACVLVATHDAPDPKWTVSSEVRLRDGKLEK